MPLLNIRTNIKTSREIHYRLMSKVSGLVAELLSKSEKYLMITLNDDIPMIFATTDEPAAYLELKSIDFPTNKTAEISKHLCSLMESELDISKERIYIEFIDVPRNMWGWNSGTF